MTSFSTFFSSYATHFVMLSLILTFAIAHSGLAALRIWAESKIGERLYRVLFALVSIPLAVVLFIFYFNHRYDGVQLWITHTHLMRWQQFLLLLRTQIQTG